MWHLAIVTHNSIDKPKCIVFIQLHGKDQHYIIDFALKVTTIPNAKTLLSNYCMEEFKGKFSVLKIHFMYGK
jgi:hypothetical protein